ncbi:mitochondrial carrier domain-containing protein [Piptocephalis cylindrospora]|uniref:Mitochondrial aspartate-glutamate transporter AGC1 n=1 Tax=Piptocephalis cylindrospora TaxID=1907219 RepID=A0A4P9Y5A0_9FUNG|nr:mitochondrial carrier domain-containing protein [Piptocephalis cylindrospora]|eukprot:RKP14113.1 mitochondrial carrier domain-containing protein [Piptocephalis cylindrospora]
MSNPIASSIREVFPATDTDAAHYQLLFTQHARTFHNGEAFLSQAEFIDAITGPSEDFSRFSRSHYAVLFHLADRQQSGLISLPDFVAFERLLAKPDAEYEVAFRLFDPEGTGSITYDKFKSILKANADPNAPPFDYDCEWLQLYLGPNKDHHPVGYLEFTQLLKGLQGERLRQEFRHYDRSHTGYISPEDLRTMVLHNARHKLSDAVCSNLADLASLGGEDGRVSYAAVRAFHNVINQLDIVEAIVRRAITSSKDYRITKDDFREAAARGARFSIFTPMEVDIIFHFAGLTNPSGRLTASDFAQVLDPSWEPYTPPPFPSEKKEGEDETRTSVTAATGKKMGIEILRGAYNFLLGSIGGAIGATVVYPIDLVKTRIQNQRSAVVGELLYKNSWDCFRKVFRNEGFLGLYSGLGPQLVGVAPEKAIKLTMNDLVRSMCTDPTTGRIQIWQEIMAGCVAGGSQVIFTNPLEIVKIRLQVQGELISNADGTPAVRRGALFIIRELGILGLYRGASACLLRDIPFSGIYFSSYAHLKKDVFHEGRDGKVLGIGELLTAGAIAGMPAAYLTTPADVIKTRLQVKARKGQTSYTGILDAARKIRQEEGIRALFKGGPARVLRSSPQFGTTLMVYELLKGAVPFESAASLFSSSVPSPSLPPPLSPSSLSATSVDSLQRPVDVGLQRSRNALKMLMDMDYKFGSYASSPPSLSSSSSKETGA